MTCPNKKSLLIYLVIGLLVLSGLVVSAIEPTPVFAQEQTGVRSFVISPPRLDFKLDPGQETEKRIKVTNNSAEAVEFVVDLKDFVVTDKSGTPELLAPGTITDNKFAASTWGTALPDRFTVQPGKFETTTLYLRVPKNARPGGRYFAVSFRPVTRTTGDGTGAAINTIVGSLAYLTVQGPTLESAKIVRFTAPIFSEYGPVKMTTEIKNAGDIHVNPKATVEVKNIFGKKVYADVLKNLNIFPGTSRVYENQYGKKWLFGRFTANLAGYYGTNDSPLMASLVFWVIPYKLIIGIILAIIIISLAVYTLKKKEEDINEPQG